MFQTEPIHFLQSFSTDLLTDFLLLVSQLGYSSFYIPVLFLITFGLDFRRGFLLIQMMLWIGLLTDLLKNVIGLPRPADLDSGVKLLAEGIPNPTPFTGQGGSGFWSLPDPETVEIFRAQPEWSFGLPSGHVSGTTTFWGGLALAYRPAVLKVVAVVMIVLMALSRMYLGRHFLADVLGGFLLGAGLLAVAYILFLRQQALRRFLELVRLRLAPDGRSIALLAFLLLVPVVALTLSPLIEAENAGRLLGLNVAFVVLAVGGLPADVAPWFKRALRLMLAFGLYLATAWLVGRLLIAPVEQAGPSSEFLAAAITVFFSLWGGVRASLGLGLYSRSDGRSGR